MVFLQHIIELCKSQTTESVCIRGSTAYHVPSMDNRMHTGIGNMHSNKLNYCQVWYVMI